ncbi:MAG: hypothetical protein ED559_05310 [Phycisphaera sp.]|nr:MAG: hypothetical protein ED559_05310 [Phycisphaera sp.]
MLVSLSGIVGCTLALNACSSRATAVYDAFSIIGAPMTARESELRVGELRTEGSISAAGIWPESARSDRFLRFTSERNGPESVLRSITPKSDGTLIIRLATEVQSVVSGRTQLELGESGDILIVSNLSNKVESDFDPRAVFLPRTLHAGDTVEREIEVTSTGPMFGSGSGRGTSVVRGIGTQTIETPAGVFDAFVIESELKFATGPARIALTQRAWIDQGERQAGMVAEEGKEAIKVFGITVHSESRVSVLDESRVSGG